MYGEWYGVYDFVVLSFHVCLDFCVVCGVGGCVNVCNVCNVCGVVCVVVCCMLFVSYVWVLFVVL